MKLPPQLGLTETRFRWIVLALLTWIHFTVQDAREFADLARVNAARALDRANTAAGYAETAADSASDAVQQCAGRR